MLLNLHIKNLALIEELEVDFSEGLNIMSGETGAGKSIIIGSIELALGGKVDRGFLREGTEESLAELIFSVSDHQAKEIEKLDISVEDGEVILSRKITGSRSINKINGLEVKTIFTSKDIPDYRAYAPSECPMCKEGKKLDAIVNSYGYSKL